MGRSGDVTMKGRNISTIQCPFEIDNETEVVMFYDRSHSQTCQVFGGNARPLEFGRPRKVILELWLRSVIEWPVAAHCSRTRLVLRREEDAALPGAFPKDLRARDGDFLAAVSLH